MRSLNNLGDRIVTILNYFIVDLNLVVYFYLKALKIQPEDSSYEKLGL